MKLTWLLLSPYLLLGTSAEKPHIVVIMADDLGYNDVGYHNPDIFTPNIDSLAKEGVNLEAHYVQSICAPSRSAILTGKYPFHIGTQGFVDMPQSPTGLTLQEKLMPEYLRELGYKTHLLGKWHLGFCKEEYLPTSRGFDTHNGFWLPYETYYTKSDEGAYNFMNGLDVDLSANGSYATHLYTEMAEDIILSHSLASPETPLFLLLAYNAPHFPLEVPKSYEDLYQDIQDDSRRIYSGMVTAFDEGLGRVVSQLKETGLYDNSVVIFLSDNGGESIPLGVPNISGNNYPLRGSKGTMWEGGVRTPAFVISPLLESTNITSTELLHITDWLPTILSLAGVDDPEVNSLGLDGVNQRGMLLSAGQETSAREGFVVDISNGEDSGLLEASLRLNQYKLVMNPGPKDGWLPPPSHSFKDVDLNLPADTTNRVENTFLLFNIEEDPTEHNDISLEFPEIVEDLHARILELAEEMVPHDRLPGEDDNAIQDGFWVTGWC